MSDCRSVPWLCNLYINSRLRQSYQLPGFRSRHPSGDRQKYTDDNHPCSEHDHWGHCHFFCRHNSRCCLCIYTPYFRYNYMCYPWGDIRQHLYCSVFEFCSQCCMMWHYMNIHHCRCTSFCRVAFPLSLQEYPYRLWEHMRSCHSLRHRLSICICLHQNRLLYRSWCSPS